MKSKNVKNTHNIDINWTKAKKHSDFFPSLSELEASFGKPKDPYKYGKYTLFALTITNMVFRFIQSKIKY